MGLLSFWPIIVIVLFLAAIVRVENRITEQAEKKGLQQADAQIRATAELNEQEASRELQTLMRQRAIRTAENVKTESARRANDAKRRQSDRLYSSWASTPVPQSVVDELRAGAEAANGIRSSASDQQPVAALRPESSVASGKDGSRPAQTLRLGPAGGNR